MSRVPPLNLVARPVVDEWLRDGPRLAPDIWVSGRAGADDHKVPRLAGRPALFHLANVPSCIPTRRRASARTQQSPDRGAPTDTTVRRSDSTSSPRLIGATALAYLQQRSTKGS